MMPGPARRGTAAIRASDVLLVFGPKKLPELGRSLGHGLREFKDSVSGDKPSEARPDAIAQLNGGDDDSDPFADAAATSTPSTNGTTAAR